jgi:hypothetical protein
VGENDQKGLSSVLRNKYFVVYVRDLNERVKKPPITRGDIFGVNHLIVQITQQNNGAKKI